MFFLTQKGRAQKATDNDDFDSMVLYNCIFSISDGITCGINHEIFSMFTFPTAAAAAASSPEEEFCKWHRRLIFEPALMCVLDHIRFCRNRHKNQKCALTE